MKKRLTKWWKSKTNAQRKGIILKMPIYLAVGAGLLFLGAIIPWQISLIMFLVLLVITGGVMGGYFLTQLTEETEDK